MADETSNHAPENENDELGGAVADDFEAAGETNSEYEDPEDAFNEGVDDIPSSGLLSFYDRLRGRITRSVERRSGKLGKGTVRVLLVVPDIFILMVRMVLDREIPNHTRALIGGALAYFLLPLDFLPEALLGVGGYVDDAVLAAAVLSQVLGTELEPYARKHWSGSEDIRVVLRDIASAGRSLLGESVFDRLKRLLEKRGITMDETAH